MGIAFKLTDGTKLYPNSKQYNQIFRVLSVVKDKGTATMTSIHTAYVEKYPDKARCKMSIIHSIYMLRMAGYVRVRQYGRSMIVSLSPKGKQCFKEVDSASNN